MQLLTLLQALVFLPLVSPLRNLSDIHFRFTTCGINGHEGPSLEDCLNYYTGSNSPIVYPKKLLSSFGEGNFEGAQRFQVPRTGLYNITVAGAAGGRGLCSPVFGKGLVWKGQLNLSIEYYLLILVGQKGAGPCDIDPEFSLCRDPIVNVTECDHAWFDSVDLLNYRLSGAGGGGGASMIRLQNRRDYTLEDLPLVVAGGGGGAAAILDYNVMRGDSGFNIPPPPNIIGPFPLLEELYEGFINAKFTPNDTGQIHREVGQRGFVGEMLRECARFESLWRAGAGGGFITSIPSMDDGDGESLGAERDFAIGGQDCALQFRSATMPIIQGIDGGFGGGGGQCGVGGGGGGYTGGSIFGLYCNNLPGGGGYSFLPSISSDPEIGNFSITSDGDGYVDIVLSNCGCTGDCVVKDDMFECVCPNDTILAPDGFDCYLEKELIVSVEEVDTVTAHGRNFVFKLLGFNTSIGLFSIDVQLNNIMHNNSNDACLLFFLGVESDVVLASNAVRSNLSSETTHAAQLASVNSTSNTSSFSNILNSAVLVTNALLISTGSANCSVEKMLFRAKISIDDDFGAVDILESLDFLSQNKSEIAKLASAIVAINSTSASSLNGGEIAGIVIAGVSFIIILISILCGIVCACIYQKSKKRKAFDISNPHAHPRAVAFSVTSERVTSVSEVMSSQVVRLPQEIFIKAENIKLGKLVGEGEFGSVYKAKLFENEQVPPKTVAVKTLKGFFSQQNVDELMRESRKMCHLNHPNVQTLIGVCIDGGQVPFLVMPFMTNGCVLSYLRRNKDVFVLPEHNGEDIQNENDNENDRAVTQTLTEMCFQIAKGMEYLAKNNIVHRDLAARNCMIDEHRVICVSDFGLSENTYTKSYYRQENHTSMRLPLKWTAPESFNFGIFSEKSDVWSFGVTCWEVFSAGKIPYPGIGVHSLPKLLHNGYRMEIPDNSACSDSMYGLMRQCWLSEADERPDFSALAELLEAELEAMSEYLSLMKTLDLGHNVEVD